MQRAREHDRRGRIAVKQMPADYRVSITNAPGKGTYPISTFTWLLIPTKNADQAKQKIIVDFLTWMVDQGQSQVTQLSYAPLPSNVAEKVRATIKTIR